MQKAYQRAVVNEQQVCLDMPLRPLCLAHVALLAAAEFPLLNAKPILPADLLLAVWICSREHGVPPFPIPSAQSVERDAKSWGKASGSANFSAECDLFLRYWAENMVAPSRWDDKDAGKGTGKVPWYFALATSMQSQLGLSEARAWSMPLPTALCYQAGLLYLQGAGKDLMSESEEIARDLIESDPDEEPNGESKT